MSRSSDVQPALGQPVDDWVMPIAPSGDVLRGTYATLEPLNADAHAVALFDRFQGHDQVWDYMPYGPFETADTYASWIAETVSKPEHFFYAIQNVETGDWEGVASYLRINPAAGSIEVGHICMSPALQRTAAATEAMYLMMQWAFDAGYRRYEWKCNAGNSASRGAAQRYGLSYEGVFRQAAVIKGRNRDTAWFAAIDREWPALKTAFQTWLSPDNFDGGQQIQRLRDLTAPILVARDPIL